MSLGTTTVSYRGRFAPSPSGPLHFGSLVCALASYLDAKQHRGEWLVRMEDIDPPREAIGAKTAILQSLQAHGLFWDRDVLFQSERSNTYLSTLEHLTGRGLTYHCDCTRKSLTTVNGVYSGHCKKTPPQSTLKSGIRLTTTPNKNGVTSQIQFQDRIKGMISEDLQKCCGDFIIHRKDGLFAYQLAVVVDDIYQGITHIVRGDDLLDSTTRQIYLTRLLGASPLVYAHIPVIIGKDGSKLSKQNHAPAINNDTSKSNVIAALKHLGVATPTWLKDRPLEVILQYGIEHFQLTAINQFHR